MTEQVLAELAADGWYAVTPAASTRPIEWLGRVCVRTALCADEPVPDWIITAEIVRAWDGRSWIVYAMRQCGTCGREDLVSVAGFHAESDPRTMLRRAVSNLDERDLPHDPHCSGSGR
ncbi:hypothetical protein GCM10023066_12770 [Nocardioides kongjuensis]